MSTQTLRVEVPRKLKPLLAPKRYKGAHGGRGGAKSHFFAEQIIIRCFSSTTRVVCIREVQKSIKDSVKQLLIDKIAKLGLQSEFEVLETEIRGPYGSLIIFVGMQSYNADNIKSLEGYDIAWVEEAQTLSQHSLDLLRPTIRKEGSEIWFSWNPRYKTDPVDMFLRKNPPAEATVIAINWRDNPWFPEVLRREMEHDFSVDADKAEHIWNGAYGAGKGAILAKWVNKADREGRINDDVAFDPHGAPVEISSDIGFRDTSCWWFWQRKIGGFTIFDYDHDHGLDADDWIPRLQDRLRSHGIQGHQLGKIWLPPDAKAKTFQSKHSAMEKFLAAFPGKIGPKPGSKKPDQVSAARRIIEKVEIHKTRCEDGIDGLTAWEYEWNEDNQVFSREPLHNWASHRGDSFAYGCEIMEGLPIPASSEPERHLEVGPGNTMTMDDMWSMETAPSSTRI